MSALVALAVVIIFSIGAITGVIVLVSVASKREDKRQRLSREAPDRTTLAARSLTSLYVRRPGDDATQTRSRGDRHARMLGWQPARPGQRAG
ncbi:MAG TPA: hypothetical protein VH637_07540 [Streptosporangiaceae bacterium]|jgi:hypothetical protein